MSASTIYPSGTPLTLFNNQVANGVSLTFTCGDNPPKNRYIILHFFGTIGNATITLETEEILTSIWHKTGDAINNVSYPCTVMQFPMSGNFRLNLSGADLNTNVTAIARFDDTKQ